ncbi:MAG: ABC transporter ATP-binding protein [Paludibacter sp.]|nr:ABC transporter ATP-binding protein [Paludibacter sp.]
MIEEKEINKFTEKSPSGGFRGLLTTENLSIGYSKKGKVDVVQSELNLQLRAGELVCLIGPNGSGKSTLLRTLTGLQKPLLGKTLIDGKEISRLKQSEKALLIALVLTERVDIENATVYNLVSLGRHPHSNWWGNITEEEDAFIHEAIKLVHMDHKMHQNINELSDGERQRAMIAKALAQDTPIIMLDEPTAHLDLPNRVEIMLLLHRLAHKTGKAILLSTHELDLALQAADRIWLMSADKKVECGVPEDLVFNGSFNRAFESKSYFFNAANGNFSMNYPMTKKVWVSGDKTRMYWTLRALARAGYMVVYDAEVQILVTEDGWTLNEKIISTVEELLLEIDCLFHNSDTNR